MTANTPTKQWWKKILDVVVQEVGEQLKAQNKRIEAMESRIEQFCYRGVWELGQVYLKHNSATDNGSLWICVAETSTRRPGDGQDWRLACKRGKDGKDARP